ncbi:MAG: ATP-binding protein [Oscillospiraceae bacterium]
MAYSENAKRFISDTLERRRNRYALRSDENRRNVLDTVPALNDLNKEITALGIEMLKMVAMGKDDIKQTINEQIGALRERQKQLLAQNGFSDRGLDPLHFCDKCADTGCLANGETCDCVKSLLRSYTLSEISKVSPLALSSFDSFSLDYYSRDFNSELGISPLDNMKKNLKICKKFAADFPNRGCNLLMLGDAGLGKTHLALSIANSVLTKGFDVIYCSAANIFKQIETEHFNNNHESTTLNSLKRCELLVLDDLGAEYNGPFLVSALYDLVNTRISEQHSTIFTTNFTDEDSLTRRYGEKISSRLIGCCSVLPFIGDDIRIQMNNSR